MKIVLFTPLAATSAIGRVSALLVPAILERHELVLVRIEREPGSDTHPCAAPLIDWRDDTAVAAALRTADLVLYQIGNSFDFHAGALHWMRRELGVVLLHDFVLAHLFSGWAQGRPDDARRTLESYYGGQVADNFFAASNHREFIETASRDHPMTEWIAGQALGVITHSAWGLPRVLASCAGPAVVAALPYSAPGARHAAHRPETQEPLQLITVGHANTNKRIESVIEAIAGSDLLRTRIVYRLCGRIDPDYGLALSAKARSLGVMLTVSGEIDEIGLQRALRDSDISCCLRWPSLEAASASTIESLLYGLPTIVSDTGFYAELPDECVRKIGLHDEIDELRGALEMLVVDAPARTALGAQGQAWAGARFRADRYVEAIETIAHDAQAARPAMEMAQTFGRYVGEWRGDPSVLLDSQLVDALAIFSRA